MNSQSQTASFRIAGALATLLVIAAAPAIAQTGPAAPSLPGSEPAAPSALPSLPLLKLTTQEEYTIREVLLTDANIPKQNSGPENIGDTVPDTIALSALPPEITQKVPKAASYKFFVKGDAAFLVRPSDRVIADVLKKKPTD